MQIIVVDNASRDGSPEMVKKIFPLAVLQRNSSNVGFAAANNQGAQRATGRFLLFLNPDTLVHPGTLAGAVAFMEQHPEAGIMGCLTKNSNGSWQATAYGFPGKLRIFAYVSGLNRFFKLSRFRDHLKPCTPDYVQGSFLVISKELFTACGGFDERFFLYAEEVDLCSRVKAAGHPICYHPDISITHHGGGSVGHSWDGLWHFMQSHDILFQKYRPQRQVKKLRRAMKFALRLRLVLALVFSPRHFKMNGKTIKKMLQQLPVADDPTLKTHEP